MIREVVSKRFEFSAGHRLAGPSPEGRFHGHNFILWLGLTGQVDERTGMIANLAEVKSLGLSVLEAFDHRNLNEDIPEFLEAEPTVQAIARLLFERFRVACPHAITPVQLRLAQEGGPGAFVDGARVETRLHGTFSAAHRTHSPALSADENISLYGICNNPAGHGHNYRVEAAFTGDHNGDPLDEVIRGFDHRNLSVDIPEFSGRNVVTEGVAKLIWDRLVALDARPEWVRVHELEDFAARFRGDPSRVELSRIYRFHAAHRLHSDRLTREENAQTYGKCNWPGGHGHTYTLEIHLAGPLDPRTETAYDLGALDRVAAPLIASLDHHDLDRDVPGLHGLPSTGENIARHLWSGFEATLGEALIRLRLRETPNNRFDMERKA